MALGLILQVSCMCFFLLDFAAALPAVKGYGYPYVADWHNIGDDGDDDALTSKLYDDGTWQAPNRDQASSQPSTAPQPELHSYQPYKPSTPDVGTLANGWSSNWGQGATEGMPLPSLNQPRDPATLKPSSQSPNGASTSAEPTPTYQEPAPAYYEPAPESPNVNNWKPQPGGGSHGVANPTAAGEDPNVPHLVFEEVFHFPSENLDSSSSLQGMGESSSYHTQEKPIDAAAQPHFPSTGSSGGWSANSAPTHYKPSDDKISWRPQKPAANPQKVQVSQQVSEPSLPLPPPIYSFKSRNGYRRGQAVFFQSRYMPGVPAQAPVREMGVKGPAASKGAKNPQSTKW